MGKTFENAMKISNYGQLAETERQHYKGNDYYSLIPAVPRKIDRRDGKSCLTWIATGDLVTGDNMEEFVLYSKLQDYKSLSNQHPEDILSLLLDNNEYEPADEYDADAIWGSKTQGERGHIYLLAIACLICARFPNSAVVYGDITYAQCCRAIKIAEEVLGESLQLPVNYSLESLYATVKKMAERSTNCTAFSLFFELYKGPRDEDYVNFVEKQFTEDEQYQFYRGEITQNTLHKVMKSWLTTGHSMQSLCHMAVADPDGPQLPMETFVKQLIDSNIHIEEKMTYDFTEFNKPDQDVPDDVSMQFSRIIAQFAGIKNYNIDYYIPLEQLKEICRKEADETIDVDAIFDSELQAAAQSEKKKLVSKIFNDVDAQVQEETEATHYDIENMHDFYYWTSVEDSVMPELDEALIHNIKQIGKFAESRLAEFTVLDENDRIKYIIRQYAHRIVMRQETWSQLFSNIMDDSYIARYLGLFSVDTNNMYARELVSVFAINPELYAYYWEKGSGED
ncbi:MAG: hypothetical protein LUE92_00150 [Clostridiales bacterium]|nr:hypothetical protein [Clostridiales bacterium]